MRTVSRAIIGECADGPTLHASHKFRHTYATMHLRHSVDIQTVQGWLGHSYIQSTMVYLKGVQSIDAIG